MLLCFYQPCTRHICLISYMYVHIFSSVLVATGREYDLLVIGGGSGGLACAKEGN